MNHRFAASSHNSSGGGGSKYAFTFSNSRQYASPFSSSLDYSVGKHFQSAFSYSPSPSAAHSHAHSHTTRNFSSPSSFSSSSSAYESSARKLYPLPPQKQYSSLAAPASPYANPYSFMSSVYSSPAHYSGRPGVGGGVAGVASSLSDISRISDQLFLSGLHALSHERLRNLGVTLVVSAVAERPHPSLFYGGAQNGRVGGLAGEAGLRRMSRAIDSMHIPVEDVETAQIGIFFEKVADRIKAEIDNKGKVLVHCVAGVSRSTSLVLAYLIKHEKMSLAGALQLVRSARPFVQPNPGFWRQLVRWEQRFRRSATTGFLSTHAYTHTTHASTCNHHFPQSSSSSAASSSASPLHRNHHAHHHLSNSNLYPLSAAASRLSSSTHNVNLATSSASSGTKAGGFFFKRSAIKGGARRLSNIFSFY